VPGKSDKQKGELFAPLFIFSYDRTMSEQISKRNQIVAFLFSWFDTPLILADR
jgi:hypothetical protein